MDLVLLRHGIAHDRAAPDCPADAERALTRKGIERTRATVRGLRRLGVVPDLIASSPLRRARETADLARRGLSVEAEVLETDTLLPDATAEAFLRWVARQHQESVLCAGHAPHLDLVVARVLGAEGTVTELGKAGAVRIYVPRGGRRGRLEWLLGPRELRRLGR